jgi:hypothetical protein
MRVAERPSLLPLIDTTLSNVIDWANTPYWYTGFAPGQVVPSAPHNTLWLLGALWNGYLDYGTVRTDDYLESSVDQRWSTTQLAYNVGDEVITLGAEVDTYVTYYVGGYRIEVDAGLLRPYGALPLLQPGATLPGRLWIYLDYGVITDPAQPVAAIRVESVAAGVPASPAAGELPLVGVDLNALGVVTGNTYDASDPELGLVYSSALPQAFLGNVVFVNDVELQGPVVLGDTLELGGMLDGAGFSIVNVDAFTGESLFVNNQVDCATLVTVAGITCGGGLDMDAGAITAASSITATGNIGGATLSSSGLSTLASASVTTLLTSAADTVLGASGSDSITVNGLMSVIGSVGGELTSDPSAVCTWNGDMTVNGIFESTTRTRIVSLTSSAAGDLSKDANDNLRWRDATATKFVHVNASGWFKGHGQSATLGAAAASLTLDTAVAVAPLTASDVDVEATCWVSRAIAGTVTVSLDEVGVGQIGTSSTITVPATGGSAYQVITFSRTKSAASTTPRVYRLTVAGGGSNVTVINGRITATPTA